MTSNPENPTPENTNEDLASRALLLRDQGLPYAKIGERLDCSSGKAHHLVAAGRERREEAACEVPRPPGQKRQPTLQRAADLVPRLARDFERVSELLSLYVDDTQGEFDKRSLQLERLDREFASGYGVLLDYVRARRSRENVGLAAKAAAVEACRATERSFTELVSIAVEADELLRVETGEEYLLSVYSRELEELAEILGLDFEPLADTARRKPLFGQLESTTGPSKPSIDSAERERRNHQIVTARMAGASATELAEAHGITERTVRRVLAEHRSGRYVSAAAAVEVSGATLAALDAEIDLLEGEIAKTEDPKERLHLLQELVSRLSYMSAVMRDCGIASPDGWAAGQQLRAAEHRARIELTHEANARVRAELEQRGVDEETIEAAIDQIVGAYEDADRESNGFGHRSGMGVSV